MCKVSKWAFLVIFIFLICISIFVRKETVFNPILKRELQHHLLLSQATVSAQTWYHEGFWHSKGISFFLQPSIEFQTPLERRPYISFPAGAFVAPYFISWLFNFEPTALTFQVYGLINQILIAILISILSLFILKESKLSSFWQQTFALASGASILFTATTQFMPNNWFGEAAGVLPFVILCLLDYIQYKKIGDDKRNQIIIYFVLAFGTYSDPSFFLELVTLRIALRYFLFKNRITATELLRNYLPSAMVILFHVIMVVWLLKIAGLQEVFSHMVHDHISRSNWLEGIPDVLKGFFGPGGHFDISYGFYRWIFILGIIFVLWKSLRDLKSQSPIRVYVFLLLLLPPTYHSFFWQWHAKVHSFNALRFDPVFALTLFTFVPFYLDRLGERFNIFKDLTNAVLLISFCTGVIYWSVLYDRYYQKPFDQETLARYQVAVFVKKNFDFKSIVFNDDKGMFEMFPTQWSAMSGKNFHLLGESPNEMDFHKKYPSAQIVIITSRPESLQHCAGKKTIPILDAYSYCLPYE